MDVQCIIGYIVHYNKKMFISMEHNIEDQRNLSKKNIMIALKIHLFEKIGKLKQEIDLVDKGLLIMIICLNIQFKRALSQIKEVKSSTEHVQNIAKLKSKDIQHTALKEIRTLTEERKSLKTNNEMYDQFLI